MQNLKNDARPKFTGSYKKKSAGVSKLVPVLSISFDDVLIGGVV